MKNKNVEIAGIKVQIVGDSRISKLISRELNARSSFNPSIKPDIILSFTVDDQLKHYTPCFYSAKGSMNFNNTSFFVDYLSEISYSIDNLFSDDVTKINIITSKTNLKVFVKSFIKNITEIKKDSILSYSLFWYVFHIELLKKKKAFIHAGIFDINGKGTILTGTGGCGKTSTLFNILEEPDFKYLSEDFGIIDINGKAYFNPKAVSIYASDMAFGKSILSDYYNKFSFKEKFWWLFNKKVLFRNPLTKASPDILLDNRTVESTSIENIVYLIRCNKDKITFQEVDQNILSDRILSASMRELKVLNELLMLMRANAPVEYKIPSFEDISKLTKEIYLDSFEKKRRYLMYVPHKTSPTEVVDSLKQHILN